MASDWKTVQVGEIADSISVTHSRKKEKLVFLNTSDVLLGKVLHQTYTDVCNWPGQAKKSIRRDDILLSEIRPANGRWAYIDFDPTDFVVSTKLMVIRAKFDHVFPRFLYHFLTGAQTIEWLQHLAESRSGTFPQITFDQVAELQLSLPPRSDQEAIARFLDCIDGKIELNRKQRETLEAMSRTLFKAWFVDFEPVRAKMQGRWQRGQSLPGMPAHLYDLFPDRLVESELGEIPEGWDVQRVSDVLTLAYGKSLPAGKRNQGEVPVYGSGGITGFHNEFLINGPAIIVGRKGTVGSLYWEELPCFPIDTVFFVQPVSPLHYCFYLLQTLPLREMNTDAAVPGLNRENVYRLEVVAPPAMLVLAFAKIATRLRESITKNSKDSETLAQLRDTLLPKLISGELRVPDAEKHAEGQGHD
jgi:type I restriction enzyme, S subunit